MKSKFTKIIVAVLSILSISSVVISPALAADTGGCTGNTTEELCKCKDLPQATKASLGCGEITENDDKLSRIIQKILNGVIAVMGVVAVIFIIIGGFNYMTSAGDAGKVQKAKTTILYACIGLIVVALAFIIVNFTIDTIDKAEKTSLLKNDIAFLEEKL